MAQFHEVMKGVSWEVTMKISMTPDVFVYIFSGSGSLKVLNILQYVCIQTPIQMHTTMLLLTSWCCCLPKLSSVKVDPYPRPVTKLPHQRASTAGMQLWILSTCTTSQQCQCTCHIYIAEATTAMQCLCGSMIGVQ